MMERQEQQWVDAARQGDQSAIEQQVKLYEQRVLALTTRRCKNPADAEEAAQEAFLSAWQGLPFFRGDASFSTWLYRLASNACVDLLRREGRRQNAAGPSLNDEEARVEVRDPAPSPQERAEQAELREQIEAGLQALTPDHRQVLILREMHQLSYDEISQVLDVDVGTVKSRINRGRKQLRNFLLSSGNFSPPPASKKAERKG